MSLLNRSAFVSAFGALVYAIFGVRLVWSSVPNVISDVREYFGTGSGGFGFFGVDGGTILVPLLLVAGSIVTNRVFALWARETDGPARAIHRAQSWTIVLAFLVVIGIPIGFWVLPPPVPLAMLPLSGVVWGVQFLVTAALLGAYGRSPRVAGT